MPRLRGVGMATCRHQYHARAHQDRRDVGFTFLRLDTVSHVFYVRAFAGRCTSFVLISCTLVGYATCAACSCAVRRVSVPFTLPVRLAGCWTIPARTPLPATRFR